MTLQIAQNILADYGYENIDKLIEESLGRTFNMENYKYGTFTLFEGYTSLNKYNIDEFKNDNPMTVFIYSPCNKVITIENFMDYNIVYKVVDNIDIDKIFLESDELLKRKLKYDIRDMLVQYISSNDIIGNKILEVFFKGINK